MTKQIFSLMALLLVTLPSHGAVETTFEKAQQSYDAGRYSEAAELYQEILDEGINNREVHYNLANAAFKNRDLPTAIQHYRIAWHATPRDPDIQANLHFALNAAGAIEPTPSAWQRFLFTLSKNEWVAAAAAGYLALSTLLILALLLRSKKRTLLRLTPIPALLVVLAIGGWKHWKTLETHPELIVIKAGATTFYGPVEGSTAHYKIPLGALARQISTDPKGWSEIEYDGNRGWLKDEYIHRVYP